MLGQWTRDVMKKHQKSRFKKKLWHCATEARHWQPKIYWFAFHI